MEIVEFLGVLAEIVEAEEEARRSALEEAAKLLQKEAKDSLGTYQTEGADWPQLAQSTQDERVQKGYTANDPLLRTGDLRDSIEYAVDGDAHGANVGSDEDTAVYQELGTSKIPARSFLGSAAYRKADEVADIIGKAEFSLFTRF